MSQVGILGIGAYLPETVRKNDWWPTSTVSKWEQKIGEDVGRPIDTFDFPITDGVRKAYAALQSFRRDPFQGAKERRVMGKDEWPSQMETHAARQALERSGLKPEDIGFVISYSAVPDYLAEPNAPTVHRALGLRESCMSFSVEAVCNSFLVQLGLAQSLIRSGVAKAGLLVQSSNLTNLMPPEAPYSAWFGDGAAAAVVGTVGEGRGILAEDHRTNGALNNLMVASVPGKRWFEDGRVVWHGINNKGAMRMLLEVVDCGKVVVDTSLERAGLRPEQVDFYASHQATAWFREVTQEHIGLVKARSLDTYPLCGSLFGVNIPMQLALAEREGMLRAGDVVAMYSGGSGIQWSGMVMRWGQ